MRLFGDGFDHYGLDETNMLDGVYATASNVTLSTDIVATGTHSLKITGNDFGTCTGIRKVLPTSKDKMGAQGHFYFPNFPSDNSECVLFDFLTSSPQRSCIAAILDANGTIRFLRGGDYDALPVAGTLIAQTDPIVVASAWNYIEIQLYIHDTLGWVRVAINGVHRYEATGLDTRYNSDNIVSVATHRLRTGNENGEFYTDNWILYDFTGTAATDTDWCPTVDGSGIATNYIGELQGMWLPPVADTAEDDWVASTGSSSASMVDEATPDDTDYASSTTIGDLSEWTVTDLPPEITYIRGLDVWGRLSKSDSGAAMIKFGMRSTTDVLDAPERPITVEPTYWWDPSNIDPDSGARWTRASLNAAWVRITRSA